MVLYLVIQWYHHSNTPFLTVTVILSHHSNKRLLYCSYNNTVHWDVSQRSKLVHLISGAVLRLVFRVIGPEFIFDDLYTALESFHDVFMEESGGHEGCVGPRVAVKHPKVGQSELLFQFNIQNKNDFEKW